MNRYGANIDPNAFFLYFDSAILANLLNLSGGEKLFLFAALALVPTLVALIFLRQQNRREKAEPDNLTITFTLKGDSVSRFWLLTEQYGSSEQLLVSALQLISIATEAKANGNEVLIRHPDGTIVSNLTE